MIHLGAPLTVWIVLLVLATFRLSWMLTREEGPFALFGKFRSYLGKKAKHGSLRWTLAELFHCPNCLGIWIAGLFTVISFTQYSVAFEIIIIWLAISGLQLFLNLLVIGDE